MVNNKISLGTDIYTIIVSIILFLVLLIAIWSLYTTPTTELTREQFFDLQKDIDNEILKLANSLAIIDIQKIKYNLTH